jgi:acyl-homoserine-lactone acylase
MRELPRVVAALTLVLACRTGTGTGGRTAPPPTTTGGPTQTGSATEPAKQYRATIRWTSYGVPHIVAADVGGLAFGQGYAMAQAHLCTIADAMLRVRGERARFFGAGPDDAHVDSDAANLHLAYHRRAEDGWATLSAESRALLDGFAAGYDAYLARTPIEARPLACRGAAWVRPISGVDVGAYALSLASLASVHLLEGAIARAHPGSAGQARADVPAALDLPEAGGSNGWAIGGDRSESGGGILIANPHFPWEGELQFFEAQLTIPGDLDVYGVSLLAIPGIQIGVTEHHAWTHTYSSSRHMVVYRLDLDGGDARRYRVGDETRSLVPTTYTIAVAQPDGKLASRAVTLYRSHLGPMLVTGATPWDGPGGHAFTVRDVAAGGLITLDEVLAMARAKDRAAFERALALHGTPFVNTIYADAAGDALYVDGSRVPAFAPEALGAWKLARTLVPAVEQAWHSGLVVADGSNPLFELVSDDAAAPGALPIAQAPRVLRRDFVMNANDSYRFTNPAAAETRIAHSPLYGDDAGRPSSRTLMNLALLRADDVASGPDHRFSLAEAAAAMLSNRSFTFERLADDVQAACKKLAIKGRPPRGCAELSSWDGRFDTASRGAALWRELLGGLTGGGNAFPWATPYDPAAPRLTPDGFTGDAAAIGRALAAAVAALDGAGGLDRPLGERQLAPRGDELIPVAGGRERDGVASVVDHQDFKSTLAPGTPPGQPLGPGGLSDAGYPVNFGSSFVLAAELTPEGVRAKALLTYGNSGDPASPFFRDQLELFARGELRPVLRTDAEIAADPAYHVLELVSP